MQEKYEQRRVQLEDNSSASKQYTCSTEKFVNLDILCCTMMQKLVTLFFLFPHKVDCNRNQQQQIFVQVIHLGTKN